MDLSTKSTPFHPPPTPESGKITEEAIPTLCGPTDLKGEYIEEEFNMVKKEDSDFHGCHQSFFSHQIPSQSPFLPLYPLSVTHTHPYFLFLSFYFSPPTPFALTLSISSSK